MSARSRDIAAGRSRHNCHPCARWARVRTQLFVIMFVISSFASTATVKSVRGGLRVRACLCAPGDVCACAPCRGSQIELNFSNVWLALLVLAFLIYGSVSLRKVCARGRLRAGRRVCVCVCVCVCV